MRPTCLPGPPERLASLRCYGVPAAIDLSRLLRPALLEGVSVLVAAAGELGPDESAARSADRGDSFARAVASTCAQFGARVSPWRSEGPVDAQIDLLVVDAAGAFALAGAAGAQAAGPTPRDALRICLDGAWDATRVVANAAFIDPGRSGRIVYVAPACAAARGGALDPSSSAQPAHGAEYADAARAGLENLSRTLSIEWARYGITLVTIAPGKRTSPTEVAAVAAYLGSPAGAYFSGCLLDLRGAGAASP
jgi:NAD(P)-dependent dehydrogenase (short-subunit alcohol dehydrogenase family)